MRITLLSVGKISEPSIRESCALYAKKIRRYNDLCTKVVPEERVAAQGKIDYILRQEGRRLRERINPDAWLVALDQEGVLLSSVSFARHLADWIQRDRKDIVFLIGGPYGLDDTLRKSAGYCLSLSPMTLPHGLAQMLLLEQIFRAFTILRGEPYHK